MLRHLFFREEDFMQGCDGPLRTEGCCRQRRGDAERW